MHNLRGAASQCLPNVSYLKFICHIKISVQPRGSSLTIPPKCPIFIIYLPYQNIVHNLRGAASQYFQNVPYIYIIYLPYQNIGTTSGEQHHNASNMSHIYNLFAISKYRTQPWGSSLTMPPECVIFVFYLPYQNIVHNLGRRENTNRHWLYRITQISAF